MARISAGLAVGAAVLAVRMPVASATAPTTTINGTTFKTTMHTAGTLTVTCSSNHTQVDGSNIGINCSAVTGYTINGTSGADTIKTTSVIPADFGAMTEAAVNAGGGNDHVTVAGSTSYYTLVSGGNGDDHLTATTGHATLDGGAGDDTLTGGSTATTLAGDAGVDTVAGGSGSDNIIVKPGDLPDGSVTGGNGSDLLEAQHAQRIFMQGRSPGGCQLVMSTPSQIGIITVGSSIESCEPSLFIETPLDFAHEIIIDKFSPDTRLDPATSLPHTRLDAYAGGGVTWNTSNKTFTKSGDAVVTYHEYFTGNFDVTLNGTWGNSDERWLHAAVRDLTDVELSQSTANADAIPIHAGTETRAAYAKNLTDGVAWTGLQVDRIYRTFLQRDPDSSGRSYWIGRIRGGTKVRVARAGFMASDEFFNNSGGTNSKYVTAVYKTVLGRAPDAGGLSYWVGRLNGGDLRSSVATALITSAETEQKEVKRQFEYYVGHDPSSSELSHWYPIIRDASDGEQQLHAFLVASNTYADRAG